jgi:membrane-associated progesterone receptor component
MFLLGLLLIVVGVAGYLYYKYQQEQKEYVEFSKEYNLTTSELSAYDGIKNKRIFVGVKGDIFDVSTSSFYTPGGSYHIFAGKDASASLAKGDLEGKFLNKPYDDLNEEETQTLDEWYERFLGKYRRVGKVQSSK